MKKYILSLFFLLNSICLCGALEVRIEPVRRNVASGSFIQLRLLSDKQITSIDFPEVKGARWEKGYSSSGMQSINGKVTHTRVLMLAPSGEGKVVIPPFKVTAGNESARTQEVECNVLPREKNSGTEVKLSDVVKGKISFAGPVKEVWAGEEVTIYCDLFVEEKYSSQIRISYFPELLNTGNAVFRTFNYRNGRVKFQISQRPDEVVENKKVFLRYRFTAQCRVLAPGNFAPAAVMQIGVVQQNAAPDEDDFFGTFGSSFFSSGRTVPYKVEFAPASPLTVKALPPVPEGTFFTSLTGIWQISGTLSSGTLHQGEVAELVLEFKGKGGAEQFRAPELKFPDFRVYPPEISRKEGQITAKYALVPLKHGEAQLKIASCFFDPVKGAYVVKELNFKAAVTKSASPLPPVPGAKTSVSRETVREGADSAGPRLYYQKGLPGKGVSSTLIENNLLWIIFFTFLVPAAAVGLELYFRRREKEANSPELRRKKALKKALAEAAAMLREKGDTPEFRSKLIPLLGEALGLSAGATAGEIAGKMDDSVLCRYFSNMESASFRPDAEEKTLLSPAGRTALLKLLKKLTLFLVCTVVFTLSGQGINTLFDEGNWAKAAEVYSGLARKGGKFHPAMLYNCGNCYYYLNDLPEARYALNLAALLDPGDGEIRANLQLVNDRLFENGSGGKSFSSTLRELRDRIRPDRYLLMASFCWAIIWLLWAFRRKLGNTAAASWGAGMLLPALLFIFCAFSQMKSTYAPDRIIVTSSKAELRTLPGRKSGSVECTLQGGGEGQVLSRENSGFYRVRINGREGWLAAGCFKRAFPGTLF